jgi:hypothetical protein
MIESNEYYGVHYEFDSILVPVDKKVHKNALPPDKKWHFLDISPVAESDRIFSAYSTAA